MNLEERNFLQVVPLPAKVIAVIATLGAALPVRFFGLSQDPKMARWEPWQKDLFCLIFLIVFFYILLIGYVCGDAKRRGMRQVLWTLLAIFIPNGIGIILYFILRDPLPTPCPVCRAPVRAGFAYCPKCATPIKRACDGCGRALETDWVACAYCGKRLIGNTPAPSLSEPGAR